MRDKVNPVIRLVAFLRGDQPDPDPQTAEDARLRELATKAKPPHKRASRRTP